MSRELKLATAKSRQSSTWKNTLTDWDTPLEQLAKPHKGKPNPSASSTSPHKPRLSTQSKPK